MKNELTQTGLEKLLDLLAVAGDREQAGQNYENLRQRLIKFFEWRNCTDPVELADAVFDRVIKKLAEGEQIQNLSAYSVTVAQFVLKEHLRDRARQSQLAEDNPRLQGFTTNTNFSEDETERRRRDCLEDCLAEMNPEKRKLLIAYYDTDERTMIPARKRLAEAMQISLNTLRIRVCRLKTDLEDCVKNCCRKK